MESNRQIKTIEFYLNCVSKQKFERLGGLLGEIVAIL